MKLYGIPNCDSVRKARKQLDSDGVNYDFIDVKSAPLSADCIAHWFSHCGDKLINKRSTSYRQVKAQWLAAEAEKGTTAGLSEAQIALIQQHPTLIKRPLVEYDDGRIGVGLPLAV